MEKKKIKILIKLVGVFIILNIVLIVFFTLIQEKKLKVVFLDVGQGDAFLVQTPSGKNILIDGGPDRSIVYKLSKYISSNKKKIDLMILSHPDIDHLTGLIEVLERCQVKTIIYNGVKDNHPYFYEWLRQVKDKNVPVLVVNGKQTIEIEDDVYLDFFWPDQECQGQDFDDDNFYSLVFNLRFKNIKVLFTGDITNKVEEELIASQASLDSDILKVSHHGSKSATSLGFLDIVTPDYAIISVGQDNPFGLPSYRTIFNLKTKGIKVLRTDRIGDIILESNGEHYNFFQ